MTAPLVRRSPVHVGQVVAARPVTARMRRVTVHADVIGSFTVRPAQDVELHLRGEDGRRVKRRYTIRQHRPDVAELDLDVVLHGAGPGARWAASAQPGDEISFQGPRGKLEMRPAETHLLIGDESALPAIAVIAESLPASERAAAVLEVRDADDEQPLIGDARWVHRGDAAPGCSALLAAALEGTDVTASDTRAYLLGETRAMVALRALLEGRGVPHDSIFVKGYWNRGRPDRLAGRVPMN